MSEWYARDISKKVKTGIRTKGTSGKPIATEAPYGYMKDPGNKDFWIIDEEGCIANALMEQEVAVRMTNFALILNDLTASFEGRNEYIARLCRAPLLILDDFGMERGTEYGLEQVYNVVDSRYRSRRPLIVTTNLSLQDLQHPQDTAHARIYDRLLEMCAPIRFSGENFRKATAQDKLARLKNLMD